jgi:redox-sensitive bicupin YhaK (pirin superfamily)
MSIRPVKRTVEARPALEGAGVRLRRAFGFGNTEEELQQAFEQYRTGTFLDPVEEP